MSPPPGRAAMLSAAHGRNTDSRQQKQEGNVLMAFNRKQEGRMWAHWCHVPSTTVSSFLVLCHPWLWIHLQAGSKMLATVLDATSRNCDVQRKRDVFLSVFPLRWKRTFAEAFCPSLPCPHQNLSYLPLARIRSLFITQPITGEGSDPAGVAVGPPLLLRCPVHFPGGPRLYWRADTWSEPRFHSARSRKQRQSAELTLLPVWGSVPSTAVLVCSGCYNRTPQMRRLGNKYRTLSLPVLDTEKSRSKLLADLVSGPTSWFTPVSSHSGKDEGFLWSPFNEDTNLIHEGSTSMTSSNSKYLPKAPPLNTIVLGVRILTYELGEGLTKHLMRCILPMVPPHSCFSHM